MKRFFLVVILAVIFIALPLLGLSDTAISVEDMASPDNEVAGSVSKAGNSSASAKIMITMFAVADE